jgi:hypothetical protein
LPPDLLSRSRIDPLVLCDKDDGAGVEQQARHLSVQNTLCRIERLIQHRFRKIEVGRRNYLPLETTEQAIGDLFGGGRRCEYRDRAAPLGDYNAVKLVCRELTEQIQTLRLELAGGYLDRVIGHVAVQNVARLLVTNI